MYQNHILELISMVGLLSFIPYSISDMASLLIWKTLFCCVTAVFSVKRSELIDPDYAAINLHFDHCRHPMFLNLESFVCECPQPLTRIGDECICEGCIYQTVEKTYMEGTAHDVPQYINEVIEDLDEEVVVPDILETRRFAISKQKTLRENKPKLRCIQKPQTIVIEQPTRRFLQYDGMEKKPGVIQTQKLRNSLRRGQVFAEGVINNSTSGITHWGADDTAGRIDSVNGTGVLVLGSGGGSAGSSSLTGAGKAEMVAASDGAKSSGFIVTGEEAKNSSSYITMVAGTGTAAGASVKTKDGEATSGAISTDNTAGAGTAITGKASATSSASTDNQKMSKDVDDNSKVTNKVYTLKSKKDIDLETKSFEFEKMFSTSK